MSKHAPTFQARFLCPKYWGIWFGVAILRLLSWVPLSAKPKVGRWLGKVLFVVAKKRRHIALTNIQTAFPELTLSAQKALQKKHFESLGLGLMELSMVWFGSHKKNPSQEHAPERKLVTYKGLEHLKNAQQQGKGVLLLSPHFSTIELTGLFLSFVGTYFAVYRPHKNPLMDFLIAKGRSIFLNNTQQVHPIANKNTRKMLKVLKAGHTLVILPDQKYQAKGAIDVPFFGEVAPSNPATSKISKLTQCAVIPIFTRRLQNFEYEIEFMPALEGFPSGDDYQDTLRLHQLYEAEIKRIPEQYLWVHNRWNKKI